jgi:hypothetical protein
VDAVTIAESFLGRIRRWWRDRSGVREAEESLERTRAMRREVKATLAATAASVRHARRLLASQDWQGLYADRMKDLVE